MPIPFSSKDYNKINLVNIADSSAIINNTITSNTIADNSIINNNFANESITSDKLSTALQDILLDFDDRITALETPAEGWSGNITFVKQAGEGTNQYISIKTEIGAFIATDYTYNNSGSNVFSVSLASPSSYLYISIFGSGGWGVNNTAFLEAVGSPTFVAENNRGWLRYTIPSQFIGQNLTYNFSTYDDD